MLRFANIIPVSLAAASLTVAIMSSSALAASQCKGMAEAQCDGAASCRWVDGYVRKDGREVNGYCRTVRGAGPEAKAPDTGARLSKTD